MLEVKSITKYFGNQKVLDNISFKLNKGEILVIFGPSGSGKTTLLKCIKGLVTPEEGIIIFNGEDNNKISFVFQEFNLWNHMTVFENITLAPLIVQKRRKSEVYKKSIDLLEKIALIDKMNSYPVHLSGGQKQRVAIAKSLIMNPDVILLDEITSSLDPELVSGVLNMVKQLAIEGMTMIIVTHNLNFAKEVGNKFIFIDKGEILEFGKKEIFENPQNIRTKDFLEKELLIRDKKSDYPSTTHLSKSKNHDFGSDK